MKKITIPALLFLTVALLYVVACQKDSSLEPQKATQTEVVQDAGGGEVSTDRGPLILGTVSTYCTCSQGRTCSLWAYTTTKRNAISITLDPVTHGYYNASGPGLRYRIYPNGSCSGAPIADFQCNQSVVKYANSNLTNGATFTVKISYGASESPCYSFTNSNCNGQSCIINDEK